MTFNTGSYLGIDTTAGDVAYSTSLSSLPAGLAKAGAGTLVLTGANAYEGATLVSAGTLQIGDGGENGTLGSGRVINNATLKFNRSNAYEVSNVIVGTGSLVKTGAGKLTLDAVAERAGLSKGGLLYNFPTKDALLQAMIQRMMPSQTASPCSQRVTSSSAQ